MLFTLEAVEEAVEGAWPHQRRRGGMGVGERHAQPVWALVALLVLPGALLVMLNLAVMAWKQLSKTDTLVLGAVLLGAGWALFLLNGVDRLRVRRFHCRGRTGGAARAGARIDRGRFPAAGRVPGYPALGGRGA